MTKTTSCKNYYVLSQQRWRYNYIINLELSLGKRTVLWPKYKKMRNDLGETMSFVHYIIYDGPQNLMTLKCKKKQKTRNNHGETVTIIY